VTQDPRSPRAPADAPSPSDVDRPGDVEAAERSRRLRWALVAAVGLGVAAVGAYLLIKGSRAAAPPDAARVQAIAGVGLLRSGSTDYQAIDTALRTGTVVPGSERLLKDKGVHGALERVTLEYVDGGITKQMDAVRRPPSKDAIQEEFVSKFAHALGIDYLFAKGAVRPDGFAYVEFVPGEQARRVGVDAVEDLDRVLTGWYLENHPELGAELAARHAVRDRQLLQFTDYTVAMLDRHKRNVMVDVAHHGVRYIDNGSMGRGELANALEPLMISFYQSGRAGGSSVVLDPGTLEVIRERLTPDVLAELHGVLARSPQGSLPTLSLSGRFDLAGPGFLERMQARVDHVLATGAFEYHRSGFWDWFSEHVGNWLNSR
jgi:hypothetical protein